MNELGPQVCPICGRGGGSSVLPVGREGPGLAVAVEVQPSSPAAALAHPEYYYGFIGAAAAWQLVYWTIGGDPARYRAFMPLGVVAKFAFWTPTFLLWLNGRTPTSTFAVTNVDLLLGIGFFVAWRGLKAPA